MRDLDSRPSSDIGWPEINLSFCLSVWLSLWNEKRGQAAFKGPSGLRLCLGLVYHTRDEGWGAGSTSASLSQPLPEGMQCVHWGTDWGGLDEIPQWSMVGWRLRYEWVPFYPKAGRSIINIRIEKYVLVYSHNGILYNGENECSATNIKWMNIRNILLM